MSPSSPSSCRDDCEALITEITSYRDALSRGESITPQGMDDRVAALCTRLNGASLQEQEQCRPFLEELTGHCQTLQDLLQQNQKLIRSELQNLGRVQQAQHAYQKQSGYRAPPHAEKTDQDTK